MITPLPHPREVLREDYEMPDAEIDSILIGGRVETSSAMALSRRFGTSVQFWLNLQAQHEATGGDNLRA